MGPTGKTIRTAYLLWLVGGVVGAHRFYLGSRGPARAMAGVFLLGVVWLLFGIGLFILAGLAVWMVVDLFLIPGLVRRANGKMTGSGQ